MALLQAEQEVQNLLRKLKMVEGDLDQAEDKQAESDAKVKDLETQVEELTRERQQLQHRVNILEGKSTDCDINNVPKFYQVILHPFCFSGGW